MPDLVHVLVHSHGSYRTGHVVENPRELAQLELQGAVLLPLDADLIDARAHSALDGYFAKSYGHGHRATKGSGERCCPMVLRVLPERNHIHWAARVVPEPDRQATGRIRLMADTTQAAFINAGLSQVVIPDLLETMPMDRNGGWTLRGRNAINITDEGFLAVALHAVTRNVRIQWSAVSLSSQA